MRALLLCLIALIATIPLSGCISSRRPQHGEFVTAKNTIFNPEWTGIANSTHLRSPWPAAMGRPGSAEEVEFTETIVDVQGRFGSRSDRLYRRFESTRRGRTGR